MDRHQRCIARATAALRDLDSQLDEAGLRPAALRLLRREAGRVNHLRRRAARRRADQAAPAEAAACSR